MFAEAKQMYCKALWCHYPKIMVSFQRQGCHGEENFVVTEKRDTPEMLSNIKQDTKQGIDF